MATTLQILDAQGGNVTACEINETWLERQKGEQAVHEYVVAFLARIRAGTAATKTRSEVRGGGAKPYRQKGTGRARAGSIRSPLWRGGGRIFGPKPRSYQKRVNRKAQRLALRRTFTERLDEGAVIVVDQLQFEEPKTKRMCAFLDAVGGGGDALVILPELDENVCLAARNLPGVEVMPVRALNPYWMLLFKKIVLTQSALELLGERLAVQEKKTR